MKKGIEILLILYAIVALTIAVLLNSYLTYGNQLTDSIMFLGILLSIGVTLLLKLGVSRLRNKGQIVILIVAIIVVFFMFYLIINDLKIKK